MDKNWKDDLAKFKIPQARLLYMIFYLFKANELNYQQKYRLKQLVMLDDQKLTQVYNNFERTKNLNKLLIDFRKIYNEDESKNQNLNTDSNDRPEKKNNNEIDIKELKIQTGKDVIKKKQLRPDEIYEVSLFKKNIFNKMTSPKDQELMDKKRHKTNKDKDKGSTQIDIQKDQEMVGNGFQLEECDVGVSPTIKPFNKNDTDIKTFLQYAVNNIK